MRLARNHSVERATFLAWSIWQRLAVAALVIAALWLAVLWAIAS